ncbi:MAG: hypothetical protein U9Q91_04405 [Candidatus Marinimicrobia bacterium]|nr:hypothetical protein [Candidatus Neomarinimicrobiota bacterium]
MGRSSFAKKAQEFDKELEKYKSELLLMIEKYKTQAEKFTYISKVQFETEYNIYQIIFETLFDFTDSSSRLFPRLDSIPIDPDEQKKEYKRRYDFYCESFNKYSRTVEINAPFIPKNIYDKFIELRKQAQGIACLYPDIKIEADDRFEEDYRKIESKNRIETENLLNDIKQLKIDVREYLATLKVDSSTAIE